MCVCVTESQLLFHRETGLARQTRGASVFCYMLVRWCTHPHVCPNLCLYARLFVDSIALKLAGERTGVSVNDCACHSRRTSAWEG